MELNHLLVLFGMEMCLQVGLVCFEGSAGLDKLL